MIEPFHREIVARDANGEEYRLEVAKHTGGLISVRDHLGAHFLAPSAALVLCSRLLRCVIGHDEPVVSHGAVLPGDDASGSVLS